MKGVPLSDKEQYGDALFCYSIEEYEMATQKEILDEIKKVGTDVTQTKTEVAEIKVGLYGIPDTEDKGLCGELKELSRSHRKLSKNFWILVAFLVGSGVLGASIWSLFGKVGNGS